MDDHGVEWRLTDLDISSATQRCHQLLTQCLDIRLLMEHEWAENRLADFNLWASGIGAAATQTDKISLDARLSGKPALLTVFTQLLQMLIGFLEKCLTLGANLRADELEQHLRWLARSSHDDQGDQTLRSRSPLKRASSNRRTSRSLSPWSDQSSLDSGLDEGGQGDNGRLAEAVLGVDSTLDQLHNLGFAIRRAGNQLRLQKADSRFDRSDHSDLKAFLEFWIRTNTSSRSPGVSGDPGTLTPIQLRLIEANLIRRNRFLYAQRHSKRLLKARQNPQDESLPSVITAGVNDSLPLYENEQPELLPRRQGLSAAGELPRVNRGAPADNSTATRLESATEILQQKIQGRDSQITSTALRVRYPNPPRIRAGARLFKCPSCCHTLDIDYSISGRWRRHLAEDICPYSCIHADCPKPQGTFVTRQAWINHMTGEDHSTGAFWTCLICSDGVEYEAKTLLFDHIMEKHEQHVLTDQIPTLLDACRQTLSAIDLCCPLCSKDEAEETRASLDHIAEHMHSFALLSLPWAPDAPAVNPGALQEASTKVVPWLELEDNYAMPNLTGAQSGPNSTTDEASLYFTNEMYFAENENMRSSSSSASTDTERDLGGFDTEGPLVFPEFDPEEPEQFSGDPHDPVHDWSKVTHQHDETKKSQDERASASDIPENSTTLQPTSQVSTEPIYPVHPSPPSLSLRLARIPEGFRQLAEEGAICMQIIDLLAVSDILEKMENSNDSPRERVRALAPKLTLLERLILWAISVFRLVRYGDEFNDPFLEAFLKELRQTTLKSQSRAENDCLLWCGCLAAVAWEGRHFKLIANRLVSNLIESSSNLGINEMMAISERFLWHESLGERFSAFMVKFSSKGPQPRPESRSLSIPADDTAPYAEDENSTLESDDAASPNLRARKNGDDELEPEETLTAEPFADQDPGPWKVPDGTPVYYSSDRADGVDIDLQTEYNPGASYFAATAEMTVKMPRWLSKSKSEKSSAFKQLEWKQASRLEAGLRNPDTSPFHIDRSDIVVSRNRYANVQPWQSSRIRLKEPIECSDYINASPIILTSSIPAADSPGDSAVPSSANRLDRRYIATQGPKETTVLHFWQMVFQESSGGFGLVIMLTRHFEAGKEKCSHYYPIDMENPNMTISALEPEGVTVSAGGRGPPENESLIHDLENNSDFVQLPELSIAQPSTKVQLRVFNLSGGVDELTATIGTGANRNLVDNGFVFDQKIDTTRASGGNGLEALSLGTVQLLFHLPNDSTPRRAEFHVIEDLDGQQAILTDELSKELGYTPVLASGQEGKSDPAQVGKFQDLPLTQADIRTQTLSAEPEEIQGSVNTSSHEDYCNVTLTSFRYDKDLRCEVRRLHLTIGKDTKIVYHYLFDEWPDFGTPEVAHRSALIELMKITKVLAGNSPRIVHDSAGVGRTGTFIALDFLLEMLDTGRLLQPSASALEGPPEIAGDVIAQTVNTLREQRMMMVMNEMQYSFIYDVLRDAFVRKYATASLVEGIPEASDSVQVAPLSLVSSDAQRNVNKTIWAERRRVDAKIEVQRQEYETQKQEYEMQQKEYEARRNPSISEHSPMIAGPSGHSFNDAPLFRSDPDFPSSDFSLFGGESSSAFSNPAAATATLFPGGPEAFATLDNDPMFDQAWNDSDFVNYDIIN